MQLFSKKSKQGWEIVAMYQESSGRKYAIIKKPDRWFESGFGYIVALGYDESDGQWAQGVYDFATFEKAKNYLFNKYKVSKVFDEKPKTKIKDAGIDAEHIAEYMWSLPREVRTIMWNIIDESAGKYKDKNEFGKALLAEGHKRLDNLVKQIKIYHDKLIKEAGLNVDLFVKDILNRNDISWDKILKNK